MLKGVVLGSSISSEGVTVPSRQNVSRRIGGSSARRLKHARMAAKNSSVENGSRRT